MLFVSINGTLHAETVRPANLFAPPLLSTLQAGLKMQVLYYQHRQKEKVAPVQPRVHQGSKCTRLAYAKLQKKLTAQPVRAACAGSLRGAEAGASPGHACAASALQRPCVDMRTRL
jgi:hypothetical protein